MQCSCGASADLTTNINNKCKAELRFYSCLQCGIVSDGVLSIRGVDVSWDVAGDAIARRWFNNLTPDNATELYQTVTALQSVLLDESLSSGAGAGEDAAGDRHTQVSFSF